jgi:hypothetical protein
MDELNKARVCASVHAVVAVVVGVISVYIASFSRSLFAGVAGLAILAIMGFATMKLAKGKKAKWWLSNGVFVYLFMWFVSWTLFFNIL